MADSMQTLYYCLGGIFSVLLLATITIFILKKCNPKRDWLELQQRINSWWVIVCLFSLAMLSPKWLALTFFGFISFLSLKEYLTLCPTRRTDNIPLLWMYAAIPLQYFWVGMGCLLYSSLFMYFYSCLPEWFL